MKVKFLTQKNPKYCLDTILDNISLFEGGNAFKNRVERFLLQRPMEGFRTYAARCEESVYIDYTSTIINYLIGSLFKSKIDFIPESDVEWLEDFTTNSDSLGTDLKDFLREALTNALVQSETFVALSIPEKYKKSATVELAKENKELDISLKLLDNETVTEWEYDSKGKLYFLVTHEKSYPRQSITDERKHCLHTFTVYDREKIQTYQILAKENIELRDEDEAKLVSEIKHNLGVVPVVRLQIASGLIPMELLKIPQIENFRLNSALSWSLKLSAYPLPVFKVSNPDEFEPKLGPTSFLTIGADEDCKYLEPQSTSYESLIKQIDANKNEIFRSLSLMNLSANLISNRSGESKKQDRENIKPILSYYGKITTEFAQNVLNLISLARLEDNTFSVEGLNSFENFNVEDSLKSLDLMYKLDFLGSESFSRELRKSTINTLVPELSESLKTEIYNEIDNSTLEKPPPAEATTETQSAQNRQRASALGADTQLPKSESPTEEK